MSRIDGSPDQLIQFLKQNSYVLVAGADEAGRGALAGPIVAAAVVLNIDYPIEGLKDSKKLTPKRRNSLFELIEEHSLCHAAGIVSASEIDRLGIQSANILAIETAALNLTTKPDCVLVDWYENHRFMIPWHGVRGGEAAHPAIAAASIIAKVTRDRIMVELSERYPEYGLDRHKGYGSAAHIEAIHVHGPSPIHRMSFAPCNSKL